MHRHAKFGHHHAKFGPAENFVKCSVEKNIRSLQVDEKIFTVETPSKSKSQNDPVYASVNARHGCDITKRTAKSQETLHEKYRGFRSRVKSLVKCLLSLCILLTRSEV